MCKFLGVIKIIFADTENIPRRPGKGRQQLNGREVIALSRGRQRYAGRLGPYHCGDTTGRLGSIESKGLNAEFVVGDNAD